MNAHLTRERVLHEIDQLKDRSASVGGRLAEAETDERNHGLSFVELRSAYDDVEAHLRLATKWTRANEMDFREVELGLAQERDTLSAICEALDRVEKQRNA